jgi:CheY-like chemotaxis protein
VLVVEDGRNAADILAMFFEMEGHTVSVAYDGAEAVERASAFRPQIIFLDIAMPKMDGLEAARQIRRQPGGREIVIVAISGFDQDEDKRHCVEAGFDCHLAKPVCPTELRAVIDRFKDRLGNL